jgi:hypothetical protein
MRLHRLFTVRFAESPELPGQLNARTGPVSITSRALTVDGKAAPRLFFEASIELPEQDLVLDQEQYLIVPASLRIQCEYAMELAVDGIAVLRRIGRDVSSIAPFIALSDLTPRALERLASCKGLRRGPQGQFLGYSSVDLADPVLTSALDDRAEGVSMLAEVLSTNHPVGKYRALLRFFENAFSLSMSQADKKVAQFLAGAQLGYSRDEVREWFALRDGSVHGDLKKAPKLVMEADVRHLLPRMQQAAHDVLLNKVEWHSPSSARRTALVHHVASIDRSGQDLRITRGRDAKLVTQALDPFGSYVVDLSGSLAAPRPGWWYPEVDSKVASGRAAVVDEVKSNSSG